MDASGTVTLPDFYGSSCDWYDVPCHATSAIKWFAAFVQWVPQKIWETICAGLGAVIQAIPVPDFVSTAGTALGGLPANVVFFADAFELGAGIGMILAAYSLRFAIRRIPLIG